jgi:hypothetical protein
VYKCYDIYKSINHILNKQPPRLLEVRYLSWKALVAGETACKPQLLIQPDEATISNKALWRENVRRVFSY